MGEQARIDPETAEVITKAAVQTVMTYLETERVKQQKAKRDRRLRNTKLLLRNYRSFKLHCADVEADLDRLEDPDGLEELDTEEFAVAAIKRSKERTLAMVRYIDHMLEVYRIICERSGKHEDLRRFKTIHAMYIEEPKKTAEEIAECHQLDIRTVYRDIGDACKSLSSLIFGIDGVRMIE